MIYEPSDLAIQTTLPILHSVYGLHYTQFRLFLVPIRFMVTPTGLLSRKDMLKPSVVSSMDTGLITPSKVVVSATYTALEVIVLAQPKQDYSYVLKERGFISERIIANGGSINSRQA